MLLSPHHDITMMSFVRRVAFPLHGGRKISESDDGQSEAVQVQSSSSPSSPSPSSPPSLSQHYHTIIIVMVTLHHNHHKKHMIFLMFSMIRRLQSTRTFPWTLRGEPLNMIGLGFPSHIGLDLDFALYLDCKIVLQVE